MLELPLQEQAAQQLCNREGQALVWKLVFGHWRQWVKFWSKWRTCITGFTTNYSGANIWLSKETALCYSWDTMDGHLAPSKLMAKLQVAWPEPEFTLTRWILNRLFWQAIKEELQYYLLLLSVLSAAQPCQHISRNRSAGTMGPPGESPALGFSDVALTGWDRLVYNRCCIC